MQSSELKSEISTIKSKFDFDKFSLKLFRHQAINNPVYADYLKALGLDLNNIITTEDIPFLPIEFFKTHRVTTGQFSEAVVFSSSGTSGDSASKHYVKDTSWYEEIFLNGFQHVYGLPIDYCLMALLPSYLEREGSSLVYMVEKLIAETNDSRSGFFLRNHEQLASRLAENEKVKRKTILLGVTYGLLDFAEKFPMRLRNTIVMETGGMKGTREELTREEVSAFLKNAFSIECVHSEYGMTELMSQAYSKTNGIFNVPLWMRVLVRETNDPLKTNAFGNGALNIIDLANIDSCAFIASQDLGQVFPDGSFKVLGRMDYADTRGCNLLVV